MLIKTKHKVYGNVISFAGIDPELEDKFKCCPDDGADGIYPVWEKMNVYIKFAGDPNAKLVKALEEKLGDHLGTWILW